MSNTEEPISRNDSLAKFIEITQIPKEIAKELMESNDWDLDIAVSKYYGSQPIQSNAGTSAQKSGTSDLPKTQDVLKPSNRSRIATIDHSESHSDDEDGEAYYQGGSERSGQQIIGASGRKKANDDIVGRMFKSAKEHGAVEETSHSNESRKIKSFSGTGYRLSDTMTPAGQSSEPSTGGIMAKKPAKMNVVLKFWRSGFSLDDGPERPFTEIANREFLTAIEEGMIPAELLKKSSGKQVDLSMEDHRNTEYVKPKSKPQSFAGVGNVLSSGSVAIPVVSPGQDMMSEARSQFPINENEPSTTVMIRLADGQQLANQILQIRERFNHTRTIADVERFIMIGHPEYSGINFVLMSTFPKRDLVNKDATLKDENLLNSVIMQRLRS